MQLFTDNCSCPGAGLSRLFTFSSRGDLQAFEDLGWFSLTGYPWGIVGVLWSCPLSEHELDFVLCEWGWKANHWNRRDLWRLCGQVWKWSDNSFLSKITAIQGIGSLSIFLFFFFNIIKILANLKVTWIFILIRTFGERLKYICVCIWNTK